MTRKIAASLTALMLGLLLLGCPEEEKGPFEKAGERLDQAAEDAREAAEDALDELDE